MTAQAQRGDTRAAVEALVARFTELYNSKDGAGLAALFAEDAVLAPPAAPVVKGREAVQRDYLTRFQENLRAELRDMGEDGNLVWAVGDHSLTIAQKPRRGHFCTVYKRRRPAHPRAHRLHPPGVGAGATPPPAGSGAPLRHGAEVVGQAALLHPMVDQARDSAGYPKGVPVQRVPFHEQGADVTVLVTRVAEGVLGGEPGGRSGGGGWASQEVTEPASGARATTRTASPGTPTTR